MKAIVVPQPRGKLCRRGSLLHFPLLLLLVSLTFGCPGPAQGAQFYTNWAAAHFGDIPAQSGPLDDPDGDLELNVVEFAFGTDPRVPDSTGSALTPRFSGADGATSEFSVEVLERDGHQPGVQIDLDVSADLLTWFRPWWSRVTTNSQPSDPPGSVRELFTTQLPGTHTWFVRSSVRLLEAGPEPANYYVATNGSDSNPGTSLAQPFATLAKAVSVANPGNLIYVRGGTYAQTAKIRLTRSGSAAQPIRVRAYPGEHPIFDFSGQTFSSSNRGIEIPGHWWHLFGLEIFGAGDNGLNITGNSNVVEYCVFHDCRDTGLQLSAPASSNLVLNCDSYHNFDTGTHGENADGFAPKLDGLGPNNVCRGCRAWENADDGWDMYGAPNPVLIEDCWSFGNGFKLGGNDIPASHHLVNCVSFLNTHHGYDQNNNAAPQTLDNCTAWNNGTLSGHNFNLNHGAIVAHVLRNNLSIAGTVSTNTVTVQVSNSWQVVNPAPGSSDVLSVDAALALAPRRDDGSLPETPFLRPVPTGRLVDQGANLGEPFFGPAPDLGAFESPIW